MTTHKKPPTTTTAHQPPPNLPTTMRAWTHTTSGPPSHVLTLQPTLPLPSITNTTRVLIHISHAALNPGGSIMMQLCPPLFRSKPCIPELDFAGTVVQLGDLYPISGRLRPGMAVLGSVPVSDHVGRGAGALSEYVAVEREFVCPVPTAGEGVGVGLRMEEAAGLPVAGSTALRLVDKAGVREGMKVLVNAAGGGIGSLVTQMVRERVGESGVVVAVCSGGKRGLVVGLGADEVLDYQGETSVYDVLKQRYWGSPFDVVIDTLGIQALFESSPGFLKPDGLFVTVGVLYTELSYCGMAGMLLKMAKNILLPVALGGVPRKYHQIASAVSQEDLSRLAGLCEARKIKVQIDSIWECEDVLKAYERMLSQRASGKIIVKM